MTQGKTPLHLAKSTAEYRLLGQTKNKINPWEEHVHFDGLKGSFEWFFTKVDTTAASVVIGITTAPFFQGELGLKPTLDVMINFPNGKNIMKHLEFDPAEFSILKNNSGVGLADNYYQSTQLQQFQAHAEVDDLVIDLEVTPQAPVWHPETGHFLFGQEQENYFGFFVVPPTPTAHVTIHSKELNLDTDGTGYVDRGWMNKPLGEILNNWNWYYWNFNEYTVMAINITFEKEYGYPEYPLFMVYKNGELLAGGPGTQDNEHLQYTVNQQHYDSSIQRNVIDAFTYSYHEANKRFTLKVHNDQQIEVQKWFNALPGSLAQKQASSVCDGAEARFTGRATFTFENDGQVIDQIAITNGPFDELQYMGHPKK